MNFVVDTTAVDPSGAAPFLRDAPAGISSGAIGYAAGGPTWLDAYHSKRPPTPPELVNAYKAIAYACIQLNAKGVTKVPLRLYAKTGPGQRKPRRSWRPVSTTQQRYLRTRADFARTIGTDDEVDEVVDHPILDAIESPNPFFDRPTFLGYMVACLDSIGVSYVVPERPVQADGTSDPSWAPSALWPIQPQYVYPIKGTSGEVLRHYRYFGDTFAPHEIVRVRHVSVRDPYLSAYAPLHACYEQCGLVDYYTASVEGILKGGAMPAAIAGPADGTQPWGQAEVDRLKVDFAQSQGGPYKGRFWFTRFPFTLKQLTYSPTDLGGLQLTKEQRLLAANCFDVPISLLQSEDSNRATARESTYQHQYYGIAPRCCLIDNALTHQLCRPVDERLFLAFDNPVDREEASDAKVFDLAIRNNSKTINEVRAQDNLPPVEWGDAPFAPAGPAAAGGEGDEAEGEKGGKEKSPAGPVPHGQADDVQQQALNGAQISSLVDVVSQIKAGVIPPESARAILFAAFPALAPEVIDRIVGPIKVDPTPAPAAPHPEPDADDRGGPPDGDADDAEKAERSALYGRFRSVLDAIERRVAE